MYALRTRFDKDIIAEFLPPSRAVKKQKVIIYCSGMPGYPGKPSLMEFFSKKGYWVFNPRFRGSWESGGQFLKTSPHRDVLDIVSQLPRGFIDLWNNKKYKVRPDQLYIFASSFGGPAALLCSTDPRINKVIAISPVVDWQARSKAEPLDKLGRFVSAAFGQAYRLNLNVWQKLKSGKFYNPVNSLSEIDGSKIMIIHAKDDDIVHYQPVAKFAAKIGSRLITLSRGGHLGSSVVMLPRIYKKINHFLYERPSK
jgi:esterase/lipase